VRALVFLIVCSVLCSCDPVGERRLRIPLSPAAVGHSGQVSVAKGVADQMAQEHGWTREAVSSGMRAGGVLRLYTIHLGDFTMHCELLSSEHEVQLYFKDWTSLREANEANRRMAEFDRKFHQALGSPKRPNQVMQRTANRPD
jgi:hypothetical protein